MRGGLRPMLSDWRPAVLAAAGEREWCRPRKNLELIIQCVR